MKTTQIAEKAKEYSFNMYDKNLDVITQIESAFKNGYKDGYQAGLDEFALAEIQAFQKGLAQKDAEWKEKLKWIPVEERLPNENKKYLVKDLYGSIHTATFNIHSKRWSLFGYSDTITHWREIIE